MQDEVKVIWKKTVVVDVLCRNFPGAAKENLENPQPE
jgi:hypothetical protein